MSGIALFVGFLLGLGSGLCLAALIAMRDPTTRAAPGTNAAPRGEKPQAPPNPPAPRLSASERHRYRN